MADIKEAAKEELTTPVGDIETSPVDPRLDTNSRKDTEPKIEYEIRKKEISSNLIKEFGQAENHPETELPSSNEDFFTMMNITERIQEDEGRIWTIDVQPDFRFPFVYFLKCTSSIYPDLEVKEHPYVTTLSLIAYQQMLYTATLLCNDIYNRPVRSAQADLYENSPKRMDLLNLLLECRVPRHLEVLFKNFSAVHDPQRYHEVFVPTLASATFDHDFGRLIPPDICLRAHTLIASNRTNIPPNELLRMLYASVLINFDNQDYTISNILGKYFRAGDDINYHLNWLATRFENVFSPVCSRALVQRPTLSPIPLTPRTTTAQEMNYYDYMFGFSDENFDILVEFISDLSSFIDDTKLSAGTLSQVIQDSEGHVILTHSVEPYTVPTWHKLQTPTDNLEAAGTSITLKAFATATGQLITRPTFDKTNTYPKTTRIVEVTPEEGGAPLPPVEEAIEWPEDLYLIDDVDYDPDNPNFVPLTFDQKMKAPDVLWFQPYMKSLPMIAHSAVNGIKIECEGIDGTIIPLPDPALPLSHNNSQYAQGSIPIRNVFINNASNANGNRLLLDERTLHTTREDALGLAFRDMTRNIVPRFAATACRDVFDDIYGAQIVNNFADDRHAFTYCGWQHTQETRLEPTSVYIWSSYRFVENERSFPRGIHMYYTLRSHYGLSPILSRSRNPNTLVH